MSGLSYETTQISTLIGSQTAAGVRTGVTLESTYQAESSTKATKSFKIAGFSKLNLSILYTMGAAETANTVEIRMEQSPDGINWYQLVNDTTSAGTSTLDAREFVFTGVNASTKEISLPLDISDAYCRVSFKESGVASNKGTLFCKITLLGQ